jgi:hypothetical protein
MYLAFSFENFLTVGIILLIWMLAVHVAGQLGVHVASWVPGAGS